MGLKLSLSPAAHFPSDTPGAFERLARCYAVLSPRGEVVTVGHRYRRMVRA